MFRAKAKEKQKLSEGRGKKGVQISAQPDEPKKTRDKLAKVADVSHDTIAKVKVIEQKATLEIKEMLTKGEKSMKTNFCAPIVHQSS